MSARLSYFPEIIFKIRQLQNDTLVSLGVIWCRLGGACGYFCGYFFVLENPTGCPVFGRNQLFMLGVVFMTPNIFSQDTQLLMP